MLFWLKQIPKNSGVWGIDGFIQWPGFESFDRWGPLTKFCLLFLSFLFGKSIFWYKLSTTLLHALCSTLVYFCARKISDNKLLAPIAGILFAVYPLNFEAAGWLGGIATVLGTALFLTSLLLYLNARSTGLNWRKIAPVALTFLLSLLCTASIWPACFAFAAFELASLASPKTKRETEAGDENAGIESNGAESSSKSSKSGGQMILIACLLPVLISGGVLAATASASGSFDYSIFSGFELKKTFPVLKSMFLPVNECNWQKYSRAYRSFYFLYPFIAISLVSSLALARKVLVPVLYSIALTFLFLAPASGLALSSPGLLGERLLYPASIGFCLLLASACSGLFEIKAGLLRYASGALALVLSLVLCILFFQHTWNENAVARNNSRVLRSAQKSIRIIQEKENLPFLILRDLPEKLSLAPAFSQRGPMLYEGQTGFMQSNQLPDGRLKEALRAGRLRESFFRRWQHDLRSFLPLDIGPEKLLWQKDMTLSEFAGRMEPGVEFYSNIHWSPDKSELLLDSNSENGPMFTFNSSELSTLDGDYLFVEAQIDAPSLFTHPRLELHYQTRLHSNYEKKERFAYTDAVVNDGRYHKYLLSLRGNGWTTGGGPRICALGFPAGAKVRLRKVGVQNAEGIIPVLKALPAPESLALNEMKGRMSPPYFNYPVLPDLGLIALAESSKFIDCNYDASQIEGSEGVLFEVSKANESFDDANSNHLSGQTYTTISQKGRSGDFKLDLSKLPRPGVYSIRCISTNASGGFIGAFSDPFCFQVPRVRGN